MAIRTGREPQDNQQLDNACFPLFRAERGSRLSRAHRRFRRLSGFRSDDSWEEGATGWAQLPAISTGQGSCSWPASSGWHDAPGKSFLFLKPKEPSGLVSKLRLLKLKKRRCAVIWMISKILFVTAQKLWLCAFSGMERQHSCQCSEVGWQLRRTAPWQPQRIWRRTELCGQQQQRWSAQRVSCCHENCQSGKSKVKNSWTEYISSYTLGLFTIDRTQFSLN